MVYSNDSGNFLIVDYDHIKARSTLISVLLSAANVQSIDDIQDLFMEMIAEFMEAELDEELVYEPYDGRSKTTDNGRNGHSKKILRTSISQDMECKIISRFAKGMSAGH